MSEDQNQQDAKPSNDKNKINVTIPADVLNGRYANLMINNFSKEEFILDFATLTGAVLVALGHVAAGILGTHDDLMNKVKLSSKNSGEKVWELPLWPESGIPEMRHPRGPNFPPMDCSVVPTTGLPGSTWATRTSNSGLRLRRFVLPSSY